MRPELCGTRLGPVQMISTADDRTTEPRERPFGLVSSLSHPLPFAIRLHAASAAPRRAFHRSALLQGSGFEAPRSLVLPLLILTTDDMARSQVRNQSDEGCLRGNPNDETRMTNQIRSPKSEARTLLTTKNAECRMQKAKGKRRFCILHSPKAATKHGESRRDLREDDNPASLLRR